MTLRALIPLPIRKHLGTWWTQFSAERKQRALLRSLEGNAVQCSVCNWQGSRFTGDHWHEGTICPVCRSDIRHRLLMAAWESEPGLMERHLDGKRILHFAPERQLRPLVAKRAGEYRSADFDRGDVDLKLDMCRMTTVADSSFDTIIAMDVLEHVPDDRAAMRELFRVLKSGGTALLSVPQKDPPALTDEDPTITTEAARNERFGQKDHVRMYGDDFVDRLAEAGFKVRIFSAADFSDTQITRYALKPIRPNPHPLSTNVRRIYFCERP